VRVVPELNSATTLALGLAALAAVLVRRRQPGRTR
jgi:uncharacterized protein (TIGR03382 family)